MSLSSPAPLSISALMPVRFARSAMVLFLLFMASQAVQAQQPELPDPKADETAYKLGVETWRAEQETDFRQEGSSPFKTKKERKRFDGLHWFDIDPEARVEVTVMRYWVPDTVDFPTSAGTIKSFLQWGELYFTYQGHQDTLVAYQSLRNMDHPVYGNLLFVPFTDFSNGSTTYGGGRYLDPPLPPDTPEGDRMILDFNTAYNPWCAFSDGWFCPIPPNSNRLNFSLQAGEKHTEGKHK